MHYSIVGDIVSSKKLSERLIVQKKLENYLAKLNTEYIVTMKKRLSTTLGDEFQGLFDSFCDVLEIIHKIEVEMWPTKVRFGIGIGDLAYDFGNLNSPYKSDGQTWWNARKAIDNIKKNKSKNKILCFSNINIVTNDNTLNDHLNSVLDLCYAINMSWTKKQRLLINHVIKNNGLTSSFVMSHLTKDFKQSVSTIYSKFKSAKYLNYVNTITSLKVLLEKGEPKE